MIILNASNIVNYLINKKVIDNKGNNFLNNLCVLKFTEIKNTRNTVFKIYFSNKQYIVKQAYNPFKTNSIKSITNEILFLEKEGGYEKTDKENGVIIINLENNTRSLTYDDLDSRDQYEKLLPNIIRKLSDFHKKVNTYSEIIPFIFSINHQQKFLCEVRSIDSFFCNKLALNIEKFKCVFYGLGQIWEETNSLIHNDLKPNNFIILNDKIELIDFEFVRNGSFYWDLADHLYNILRYVYYVGFKPDGICSETNCKQYSRMFLSQYYDSNDFQELSKNTFFRNALCFFVTKMIYYFFENVKNKRFVENQEFLEYSRILYFWEVIENFENEQFNFIKYVESL